MKTKTLRRNPASIAKTRWAAYAAAGAATAFAGTNSAEAAIHYSGRLDAAFPRDQNTVKTFQLDQPGDSFQFDHNSRGRAHFSISGIASAAFRGINHVDYFYVSKLNFGQNISAGYFLKFQNSGVMAYGCEDKYQWSDPGIGYVGFRFNSGAGIQYGWARVRMGGCENNNGFKVLEYAYGDPGEAVTTGQRSSNEQAPDQGSLGWLAAGAAGLVAWRRSRSRTTLYTRPPSPV